MRFPGKKWIFAGMLSAIVLPAMVSSAFCETLNLPDEYSAIEEAIYAASQAETISQNCGDCHYGTDYGQKVTLPHHDCYMGGDPNSPYNPNCPDPPPMTCEPCHYNYDENNECQRVFSGKYGEGCGMCHTFDTCSVDDWKFLGQCIQLTEPCSQPPDVMIQELIATVINLNLQRGISNAIDAKLDTALSILDDMNTNNDVAAINSLNAFINAVEAQRGKEISNEEADNLVAAAQAIISKLEAQ